MDAKIKVLKPDVNLSTLTDGRGGVFTYFPERDSIIEWSYIVTHKENTRGHHHHPEFDEYIMFVRGHGCYVEKLNSGGEEVYLVGPGDCLYIPAGTNHTFRPLEDCTIVTLLTKKWKECDVPIVKDS